jgi:hypothetical protein
VSTESFLDRLIRGLQRFHVFRQRVDWRAFEVNDSLTGGQIRQFIEPIAGDIAVVNDFRPFGD